ncbi:MAG TPA: G8 domain-containing protein, partial [Flavisolibacter sp.]|nr:G8 domain-containing protein [Flavisolibacter sp.]
MLTTTGAKAFFIPPGTSNYFFYKLVPYATITSTATGGAWSNPLTWSTGVVPTSNDDVVIPLGSTVTIDADNLSCQSITINGTLAGNGSFNLNVYGNWLNNGFYTATIDTVRFAGSTNATISGTSATTFNNIKIDKSGNASAIVEAIGGSGVTNNGNISLANGIFKVSSGIFQFKSNPNIPSTAGLWVNGGLVNSVSASFSVDNNGLVRVSAGTLNVGTSSGNSLTTSGSTGKLEITGGVVNIAGRLENTNGSAVISGGVITVSMIGNGLSSTGSFHISANTDLNMSGGTVVFQNPGTASTPIDLYIVGGGTGIKNITGGTFQFGNSSTPASSTFLVNSVAPVYNLSINNANTPSVK